jgi:hypothetical protein
MFDTLRRYWKLGLVAALLALNLGMVSTNLSQEVRLMNSDQVADACSSCWKRTG